MNLLCFTILSSITTLACLVTTTQCATLSTSSSTLNVTFLANTTINTGSYSPYLCGLKSTLVVVYNANIPPGPKSRVHAMADNFNLMYILFKIETDGRLTKIGNSVPYAEGNDPFIAGHSSSNMVIAVNGDAENSYLCYHIGKLTGTTIEWLTPPGGIPYVQGGAVASISVNNDGTVIAAHQISTTDPGTYFCVGKLNTSTGRIMWYNSTSNGLCNPHNFQSIRYGWKPRVQVTNDGRVVFTHVKSSHGMYYSIGKLIDGNLSSTAPINWVTIEKKYISCYSLCSDVAIMVDPFGMVLEVHLTMMNNPSHNEHQLNYKTGILHDNYIQWKDTVGYSSGAMPAIAFLNGTNYLYGEVHSAPNYNLQISTIAFGVELINITYGSAVPNEKVLFDTDSSDFENNGPGTIGKTWAIKSDVSCTNTHSWDLSLHAGISVTTKVNFFFASASATMSESISLTIGQSYSSTKTFTWEEEEKITVPSHVGKVTYSAAIYRVPHTIPFVATFKRGPFTWEETGSVYVTHGTIFTYIYASQ